MRTPHIRPTVGPRAVVHSFRRSVGAFVVASVGCAHTQEVAAPPVIATRATTAVAAVRPASSTSPHATTAVAPGTMELPNPSHQACAAGYGDQALLDTCNKSCTTDHDCTAPFTCESLGGDPPHNCVDMGHLHMRGGEAVNAAGTAR